MIDFTPGQINAYFFAQKLDERGFKHTAEAIRRFGEVPERPKDIKKQVRVEPCC